MPLQQVQDHPIPEYVMPDNYKADNLDVSTLNIYISASEADKNKWKSRGHVKSNIIDYTTCSNEYIREQYKYFIYYSAEIKKLKIGTFASTVENLKYLTMYVNENNIYSVREIDANEFKKFLIKNDVKIKTKSSKKLLSSMERKQGYVSNRYFAILNKIVTVIKEYDEKDIPEIQKDIWRIDRLPIERGSEKHVEFETINFSYISQEKIKITAKKYIYGRLFTNDLYTVRNDILCISYFTEYLAKKHPEVKSLSDLSRFLVEDYFLHLRTSGKSSYLVAKYIGGLRTFFEIIMLMDVADKPPGILILSTDYKQPIKRDVRLLSDNEMKQLFKYIEFLPSQISRMFFVHAQTGLRIGELCELKTSNLHKDKKSHWLEYTQTKTSRDNKIPISELVFNLLIKSYEESKAAYGDDTEYIFAQSKSTFIRPRTYSVALNELCYKYKIKKDDGSILHITTHMLRATLASKLANLNCDIDVVNKLLGHSAKSSIKSYVKASNKTIAKYLDSTLKMQELLISNIFNPTLEKSNKIDKSFITLDNGFCGKNKELGICHHANACLGCSMFVPSAEHLLIYKIQLNDVLFNIKIAEQNDFKKELDYNLEQKRLLEDIIQKLEGGNINE